MQNNLMKVEDDFQEENEINIYDLINIFIKNIKLFVIISILGVIVTCLYIGKRMVFDKNNTIYINYTLNYQEINSYIGDNIYYPKKTPKEILLDNKYIELLFENPELRALYEEKIKKDRDNIDTKRQFLINNKVLETSTIKELTKNKDEQELISPDSYRTTVRVNRRNDLERKIPNSIMTTYLDILKQYYKETDNNYFKYIYPIQVSNIDTYYEKYKTLETEYQAIKTLFDLELNKTENFIKYDSSIIVEKEKSGNIIKLGVGIFLSLCLGVLATFIKELIEGYKKNKKDL